MRTDRPARYTSSPPPCHWTPPRVSASAATHRSHDNEAVSSPPKARIYLMVEVQRLILQQRRQWDSGVDLNNLAVGAIPGAGVCAADNRLFVFITDVLSAPNNGTNNWEEHKSLRKQRWFTVESVFFFIQMHRSERPADIESRPCAFSVNMLVSDEQTVWNETLGYLTLWICHHWKFLKCCFGKKKLAQSLPN